MFVTQLSLTLCDPRTVARQAPPSMVFSRQESWSGLPCSPPGDLPNPGLKPMSLRSPALAGRFFSTTWKARLTSLPSLQKRRKFSFLKRVKTELLDNQLRELNLKQRDSLTICTLSAECRDPALIPTKLPPRKEVRRLFPEASHQLHKKNLDTDLGSGLGEAGDKKGPIQITLQ